MSPELRVDGSAIAYRLFDVGYAINLDHASALTPTVAMRVRPARPEAQALQIHNPPLLLEIGTEPIVVHGCRCEGEVFARLYDFGVCALQIRVPAPPSLSWDEYAHFGRDLDVNVDLTPVFDRRLRELLDRLGPAIERPQLAPVTEDYVVFRFQSLRDVAGAAVPPQILSDEHLVPLLLGERRKLSEAARRELLPHRFSYYAEDLTILTWDNALVVEPDPHDRDVEYVLEFANAQLLELRVFDASLDAELPAMYDRVEASRAARSLLPRRFQPLLAALQTRVADVTETVERVENALKVTDDVYLARIYAAALELFRGQTWRQGIDRKLGIFRDTYAMLDAEARATRAEVLEVAVIVLIVAELVVGLLRA